MRIAVVGTGIAGNVVANRLCKEHEIVVYESNDYIGGHSNTVVVPSREGDIPLDTGFVVFNDRTYPNFLRLLSELDVRHQASSMSFSVQCERSSLEYNGSTLNSLFAQRRNLLRPSFHRMIRDILRFNREALELLDINTDSNKNRNSSSGSTAPSLAEYLKTGGYSREFTEHYLIPMGAAIWSAEPDMLENMPARFFVRFFHNHGLMSIRNRPVWQIITGGSQSYVAKLVAGHRDRIRLKSPVCSVMRQPSQVLIKTRDSEAEAFDYVFLACHSDQALRLLNQPLPLEREVLGAIPYQSNDVILHTDESLMPRRRRAWAAWNYHVGSGDSTRASLTYHLNRLQGLNTDIQYFITLNTEQGIQPESIIKKINYEHPVFTAASVAAQSRHEELNGLNRTYYCGAYWRNGFHEDGVVSALTALAQFDARNANAQQHFQRTG